MAEYPPGIESGSGCSCTRYLCPTWSVWEHEGIGTECWAAWVGGCWYAACCWTPKRV